ncbi:acyltransferase family protein [Gloeobacter morelensis]|uniref:Acyltransferase n=1 Tax=Gloeobacter morelensis MG652769 TaxID=2781736 RepID=A0ABY3PRU2_9CYAN|nr:acyltransferase family protein [Gloeobacter morelensis]UFP96334.1 acyltransferase [Gloeobacter morelensis MG652769]
MTTQLLVGAAPAAERPAARLLALTDCCKGFAIGWVFLFHYQYATGLTWLSWAGWQGVHIFIVLSGFGLTYSLLSKHAPCDWRQWLSRRVGRILPGYWLTVLIGLVVALTVRSLEGGAPAAVWRETFLQALLDALLLRDLSHRTITPEMNVSLWFVPFILGMYLLFPALFALVRRIKTLRGALAVLAALVALECAYRAYAIFWCNGWPIAYGVLALPWPVTVDPALSPFQLQAPFGLPFSRIAEFGLGMLAAVALVRAPERTHRLLFGPVAAGTGLALWVLGNALVFVGPAGWVASDLLLAAGLALGFVNLAWTFEGGFAQGFEWVSRLGVHSYPVFLCHAIFVGFCQLIGRHWLQTVAAPRATGPAAGVDLVAFATALGLTCATSWLLVRFDAHRRPPAR